MEPEEIFGLVLVSGLIIGSLFTEKIETFNNTISGLPNKLLTFITSPIFIISAIILVLIILIYRIIHNHNLRLKEERLEIEQAEKEESIEKIIVRLVSRNTEGLNSREVEGLIRLLEQHNYDSRVQDRIADVKKDLRRVEIEEYRKTDEYQREKLLQEIKELQKQKYQEELELKDYHDAVLRKLNTEGTLIYNIEKLNKKEIEVLEKEDYKKVNEHDPIEKKNSSFLVKQILNHSPSHTFLVARIKQLLEDYISPNKIRTHDTRDADLTFEIKYKIYAFEIEKGSLLSKKKQLREKVSFLNNKYGQNWYFIVTNRNLAKKYRKYGKVTSRMGVRKIIEKLVGN